MKSCFLTGCDNAVSAVKCGIIFGGPLAYILRLFLKHASLQNMEQQKPLYMEILGLVHDLGLLLSL